MDPSLSNSTPMDLLKYRYKNMHVIMLNGVAITCTSIYLIALPNFSPSPFSLPLTTGRKKPSSSSVGSSDSVPSPLVTSTNMQLPNVSISMHCQACECKQYIAMHRRRNRGSLGACAPPPPKVFSLCRIHSICPILQINFLKNCAFPPTHPNQKSLFLRLWLCYTQKISRCYIVLFNAIHLLG